MALRRPIQILIEAKDKTAAAFRSINKKFSALVASAKSFTAVGIAGAATAAAVGLNRLAQSVDRVSKDAQRLKLTREELQKLQFLAEQTGFSADGLVTALQRMIRRISEAAIGTGEAKNALEELGLVASELNELSPDEQFKRIAEALQDIGNSADKTRLIIKIFDSEAAKLVNTLEGGRDAIKAYGDEFEALGGTFSGDAAKGAAILNETLNKLGVGLKGVASAALTGVKRLRDFYDAASFLATGQVDTGNAIKDEFTNISLAVKSITDEIRALKAEGAIGEGLYPVDVSNSIAELEDQLKQHKERLVELLKAQSEKQELKSREQAERQHNREMASVRDDQTKALQATLQNRLKLFQEHITNTQSFQNQQRQLTEEINRLLNDIGTSSEPVERIDVLRKSVEAWDQLGQGNFGKVLSLVKDGLGLLSEYEGTGEASSASVTTLKESFKSLAEQAGKAQDADLTKSVKAGQEQFAKLKKEISTKPATLIVIPDQSSGKNVHTETQRQLKKEGPVVVDVALNITGVVGQSGGGDVGADQGLASEVESQSDKRGHRV